MFFDIYIAAYLVVPDNPSLPDSADVRDCFYNYFINGYSENIDIWFGRFQEEFNEAMHYLRAIRAVELVVEGVLNYEVTEQCKISLMKLESCASCAGYESSSMSSCNGLCLNILRGCLLDLSDLVQPIKSFSQVLITMKDHIKLSRSFFNQVDQVQKYVYTFLAPIVSSSFFADVSETLKILIG